MLERQRYEKVERSCVVDCHNVSLSSLAFNAFSVTHGRLQIGQTNAVVCAPIVGQAENTIPAQAVLLSSQEG